MPGILPMKVIKLGTSAQSRIAQACDRCRSKKIRCDGITPCCTQCSNVGFECKTSDKLSRRAFPRGYTESLEERVRSLENEVRELKDLLDEKDEKIDILSRIHSGSPASRGRSSEAASNPCVDTKAAVAHETPKEDIFKVQQSPNLLNGDADSYFMGASSGRAFVGMLTCAHFWRFTKSYISRCVQSQDSAEQQAMPGHWNSNLLCILQKCRPISHWLSSQIGDVQSTSASCLGSDGQYILPRMGSSVPRPESSDFSEAVYRIRGRS